MLDLPADLRKLPKDRAILPTPRGHAFTNNWKKLQELAEVQTPVGEPYEIKSFRKLTASVLLPLHAELPYIVCGWGNPTSAIAWKHYLDAEETLVEHYPRMPLPDCFREWLPAQE